MAVPFVPEL